MDNPSSIMRVVRIMDPCDPAIDVNAAPVVGPGGELRPVSDLLSTYERTRSDADRDALPLLPGMRPYVFDLKPLTRPMKAPLRDFPGDAKRCEAAVAYCCHAYTTPSGERRTATTRNVQGIVVADERWLDELDGLPGVGGSDLFDELGTLIIRRGQVPEGATDPFALPRGRRLAR